VRDKERKEFKIGLQFKRKKEKQSREGRIS
jgi:hypothetical protein